MTYLLSRTYSKISVYKEMKLKHGRRKLLELTWNKLSKKELLVVLKEEKKLNYDQFSVTIEGFC